MVAGAGVTGDLTPSEDGWHPKHELLHHLAKNGKDAAGRRSSHGPTEGLNSYFELMFEMLSDWPADVLIRHP